MSTRDPVLDKHPDCCEAYTQELAKVYSRLNSLKEQHAITPHPCECCGKLLRATRDHVGPECVNHPERFPCKEAPQFV